MMQCRQLPSTSSGLSCALALPAQVRRSHTPLAAASRAALSTVEFVGKDTCFLLTEDGKTKNLLNVLKLFATDQHVR